MTTPIQAAIEALTRWTMKINGDNPSMEESPDGNWYWREDVHRAVLQAAPAQQEDFWSMTIEPIDPELAKYTYDNFKVVGTFKWPAVGDTLVVKIPPTGRAAPAPIADEVAGEWALVPVEPTDEMREACTRNSYCDDIDADWASMLAARPPAPKASAPDAPAGDFPPLPENFGLFTADQMHAFVLADRAARTAAAPAGHAEPLPEPECVVLIHKLKKMQELIGSSLMFVEAAQRAAPVAAEPAPQVIYREPTDEERSAEAVAKLCGTAKHGGDHE